MTKCYCSAPFVLLLDVFLDFEIIPYCLLNQIKQINSFYNYVNTAKQSDQKVSLVLCLSLEVMKALSVCHEVFPAGTLIGTDDYILLCIL